MTVWKAISSPGPRPPWRVILLDRDGVLIEDRNYLADPAEVCLIEGAGGALSRAHNAGWALVGISNQSGLGRGYFTFENFQQVMVRMEALLAQSGCALDGFFFCPHGPDAGCWCRKPKVGLIEEAGLRPGLDSRSWLVGDKLSDIELGQKLGVHSILVRTGYGTRDAQKVFHRWGSEVPIVDDLPAAIELILKGPQADDGEPA